MDQLPQQPKKIKVLLWFVLIVIMLFIIFGGLMIWRTFLSDENDETNPELENAIANAEERFADNSNNQLINTPIAANSNNTTNNASGSTINTNGLGQTASAIVGTWLSDCLVPDQGSPWSERHQFVIKADGTAVHTRWSGSDHDCTIGDTLVNTYTYTIPQPGQINLTDQEMGLTMYDIYQISGDTLKFGHGFQSPYPVGYDATQGDSAANRFHDLNNYIVYKK